MSQPDFYAILDQCVSRLRQSETPEACLADYPAYATELAPDLALTAELLQLSPLKPSPAAVADGYQKMMAALDSQEVTSPATSLSAFVGRLVTPLWRQQRGLASMALRAATIAVLILVVAGSLVVTAAAGTLPGDALYPVKRSWESTRLTLTVDESSRQALRSKFERRRREEVQAVLDLRRPVIVEFKGDIDSLVTEVWQVSGLDLAITDDTLVIGVVTIGQSVTVRAQVQADGTLNALKIVRENSAPSPGITPPTVAPQPTETSLPTRNAVAPSPTPAPEKTRPEPTATQKPTIRPTREPTSTPTPATDDASSVGSTPTRAPQPTSTRPADSLVTSPPRPTRTPANTDPTPTVRPATEALPTPTATAEPNRDLEPSRPPTATRGTDTEDRNDRPP